MFSVVLWQDTSKRQQEANLYETIVELRHWDGFVHCLAIGLPEGIEFC